MAASSFSESRSERSRKAFRRLLPPKCHITALATGGLKRLYATLQESKAIVHNELGKFTDDLGRFQPPEGFLLASRYQVVDVLPRQGQSAMLIKAQDVVQDNSMVMIKALHSTELYFEIGFQETYVLRRLACADPHGFSHTVRLLNTFLYDHHFCLVFELLDPRPITNVLTSLHLSHTEKLSVLRKVTLQLLQVVGFLQQNNTIHADLKPENILLRNVRDMSSLRVIDFGNAINHVHQEMSLYYQDFQVQTLLYRAPEVVFGIPFGAEIDMWSVGCILAEIYLGEPLIFGTDPKTLAQSMVDVLGPLPRRMFQRGKYFDQLEQFTENNASQSDVTLRLMKRFQHRFQPDFCFTNLLAGLLSYDPDQRLAPAQAAQHPFLAPEVCLSYLMLDTGSQRDFVSTTFLSAEHYKYRPAIAVEVCRQAPSSTDLLRMGTGSRKHDVPKDRVVEHTLPSAVPFTCEKCAELCQWKLSGQFQKIHQDCFSQKHPVIASMSAQSSDTLPDHSKTDNNSVTVLHEAQITCTHTQNPRRWDYLPLASQGRESPETICQSPDTTCVMELNEGASCCSQVESSRQLLSKSLENTLSQAGCRRCRHHLEACSVTSPAAPAARTSVSNRVSARLQKTCVCSQNESSGERRNSQRHSCETSAIEISARRLLSGAEACSSTCSEYSRITEQHCWKSSRAGLPVCSGSLNETFTGQDAKMGEKISEDTGVPLARPDSPVQVGAVTGYQPKHPKLSLLHDWVRQPDGKLRTSNSPTSTCLSQPPGMKYSKLNTMSPAVDSVGCQSTGPCTEVAFDSDSDDSGHEKLRRFIHNVSQGTPLAQLHPATDQGSKEQIEVTSWTLQKSAAGSTVMVRCDQRDADRKGGEFVCPSRRSRRKVKRSARKFKSEGLGGAKNPEPRARKHSECKVGGIRRRSCKVIHSSVKEFSQGQPGRHNVEVAVPHKTVQDVPSSNLQPERHETAVSRRAAAHTEEQLTAVTETTTTTCGMPPLHQDGTIIYTATSPYVDRNVIKKKLKRKSLRNTRLEACFKPEHTQAAWRFLARSSALHESNNQKRPYQSMKDERDSVSPYPPNGSVFVLSGNKITHSQSQACQEAGGRGVCQAHCGSQHGWRMKSVMSEQSRQRTCRNSVKLDRSLDREEYKLWPSDSKSRDQPRIAGYSSAHSNGDRAFSNTDNCLSLAGADSAHSNGDRAFSNTDDGLSLAGADSAHSNGDRAFSNPDNGLALAGADRVREWPLHGSPARVRFCAGRGECSVAERNGYVGGQSPAADGHDAVTESPPVQRVLTEGPDLSLQHEADHKLLFKARDASERHKEEPGRSWETSDDGDDDVIMLIQ